MAHRSNFGWMTFLETDCISCGETPNLSPLGPRRLGMEGVADHLKTSPSPYVLPRSIWSFFLKD